MSGSSQLHRLNSPQDSPGQNSGVGSLSLLQGILPTQGRNAGPPHCRQSLYRLSPQAPQGGRVSAECKTKETGGPPGCLQGSKALEEATVSIFSGAGGAGARGRLGSHGCVCHPAVAALYTTYVWVSLTRVEIYQAVSCKCPQVACVSVELLSKGMDVKEAEGMAAPLQSPATACSCLCICSQTQSLLFAEGKAPHITVSTVVGVPRPFPRSNHSHSLKYPCAQERGPHTCGVLNTHHQYPDLEELPWVPVNEETHGSRNKQSQVDFQLHWSTGLTDPLSGLFHAL